MTATGSNVEKPPIISLRSKNVVKEIEAACSTWGAFVLTDHDITTSLLSDVQSLGHEFFSLPLATKQKYNLQQHGAKWRGYMPLGGERSVKGEIRDYNEGLYMGDEHAPGDPHLGLPTFGSNVFPDKEIPQMRPVFTEYHARMKDLGNKIMRLLSLALDLDEDYLETHVTRKEPVVLPRMFRYLPQSEENDPDQQAQWGIGRHSDYGLWTMIVTDAPGLEFQHPAHETWHAVPFIPDGIIMNVGDVLDRLTAGRFVSAYHRARNHSSKEYRLSLPFFYDPSWEARMQTLPIANPAQFDTPARAERWANTKITCEFNGKVEYSEFLAKKVAKVFPDLVPEEVWKSLRSTSEPSTRHALVVKSPDVIYTDKVIELVKCFYRDHCEIKVSHGLDHIMRVYHHAVKAIACHAPPLSSKVCMEIKLASLLHDADDTKYFPTHSNFENARSILKAAEVPKESCENALGMIRLVSCSKNGNHVPDHIRENADYHLLIPRWADRLEAVGAVGLVRCFQYNQEHHRPLSSPKSPRAQTEADVWKYATSERFDAYTDSGGSSDDMISHYYDKLLHVACPPKDIVRNPYLENQARESSKELVEMCIRFGKTGEVDEGYVREVARELSMEL